MVSWFGRVFWIKVKMLRFHEVTPVRTPVAGSGLTVTVLGKGQNHEIRDTDVFRPPWFALPQLLALTKS